MGMALISLALLTWLPLVPWVLGQYTAYNYGFDVGARVKRDVTQPLVVRGGGEGDLRFRQEVREMEQDQDLWTLYILGLSLLQFTDQSSPTSWYGITGIHGIPHKTWGGVGPTPGNEASGYCTHSSILFPTWHRPYLVLYEQVMYSLIQSLATWWPEGEARNRYQQASLRFRIPYWDWAANPSSGQSVLPQSVGGSPYVDVNGPSGIQRIANPLFSYSFKPLNSTAFIQAPWDYWAVTLRSPTDNSTEAQSNNSLVALNFDQNVASLSQRLYILFSNYANYSLISNNAWIPLTSNASYDSIESLHDTVHNLAGGGGLGQPNVQGGHMSYIPYSAFDPIFFLHHTMVDRIFSIWQALYPETWVVPTAAALPSYTTSKGQVQDSRTALTPFYASTDGTFWTSDTVRDHTQFGYTYAELAESSTSGPNASRNTRSQIRKAINRLYGTSSPANLFIKEMRARGSQRERRQRATRQGELNEGQVTSTSKKRRTSRLENPEANTLKGYNGVVFVGDKYREWIANIRVKKQSSAGPFSVHFFLGSVPDDPQEWAMAPSHIGTMGVFAADQTNGMPLGQLEVSGTVPLTTCLIDKVVRGELSSLEPYDVEPYLTLNLQRRLLSTSGKILDVSEVGGLHIHIISAVVRAPSSDDELPLWGQAVDHFDLD
ncbi:hypothetical protein B0T24DRAFT_661801 [Lasiosphaeria ovina]|uniref:Tyrosinase copper-binding domain-containing protein n=1 Tax=Lasiosphaeria ovina TaxID=92902 RepID=A0AAE0TXL8_9PEZI|nr:hypothetical protein B0T24DRAFT_661801 [Lasiosphaeria ovina]